MGSDSEVTDGSRMAGNLLDSGADLFMAPVAGQKGDSSPVVTREGPLYRWHPSLCPVLIPDESGPWKLGQSFTMPRGGLG